jgi:2-polyprenyl-6-methoxyphenol hydroxylase-like FAD-dependent oxidoreductase
MNTGIGDAVNLSWKLAAALRLGHDASLASYEIERQTVETVGPVKLYTKVNGLVDFAERLQHGIQLMAAEVALARPMRDPAAIAALFALILVLAFFGVNGAIDANLNQ